MRLFGSIIRAVCCGILGNPARSLGGQDEIDDAPPLDSERVHILPSPLRTLLFRYWPLVLLLQWCIVIPAALARGIFFSLPGAFPAGSRVVPFASDFFFIVWNLLPFALGFCTWLIEGGLSRVVGATHTSQRDQALSIVRKMGSWVQPRKVVIPLALAAIAIAVLGCVQQFLKVARWSQTQECTYWWQAQFSQLIFYVRLITLAVNMFCIVFDLAALLILLIAFARLAHARLWKVDLLHADGCAGVAEYGRAAMAFTTVPFLAALCGLLGYYDHRAAGALQTVGDTIMLVVATGFGALTFILPLRPLHQEMVRTKRSAMRSLHSAIGTLGSLLPPEGQLDPESEYMKELKQNKEHRELLVQIYKMYAKAPTWPLNVALGARLVGIIAGPLAVFIIDQVKSHVFG